MSGEHASNAAPDDPRGWNDDFAAEAADHLAESVREAQEAGATDAANVALQRFGSLERIWLRCFWVHEGNHLMFRMIQTSAVVLSAILLAVLSGATWQGQRRLAGRLNDVDASIQSVAAAQGRLKKIQTALSDSQYEANLAANVAVSPVLRGSIFLGSPQRSAKDFEFDIRSANSSFHRKRSTGVSGRFDSGLLPNDEYVLLFTPVDASAEPNPLYSFTSRRFDLTGAVEVTEPTIDAALLDASVKFEFAADFPLTVSAEAGTLMIVPETSLATWDGTALEVFRDAGAPTDSYHSWHRNVRYGEGTIRGYSHRGLDRLRQPTEQYLKEHIHSLTTPASISSGDYVLLARFWAVLHDEVQQRRSQAKLLQLMELTAIQTLQVAPGDDLTIEINGVDLETLREFRRAPNPRQDQEDYLLRPFDVRTIEIEDVGITMRRSE